MHTTERDQLILELLSESSFIGLQDLCDELQASPATVRRDLERLEKNGQLQRVRGGARAIESDEKHLQGTPFNANLRRQLEQKMAIGKAAAKLCAAGDAIIIDGGTTTFQMCPHLEETNLQVLTNSLHIVDALLPRTNVQLSVPGGSIFREQNIILSPFDDDGLKRYHASKMFMGAAAISDRGLSQVDSLLIQAERKLMARADKLIVLVDSSKFSGTAGHLLCGLDEIDMVITDDGISRSDRAMLKKANIELIVASV